LSVTQPVISVVIPAFNAASTLAGCVTSIGSLESGDVEIIIVNDASTDDTQLVANEMGERYSAHVLEHVINTGVVYSRNDGLKAASGHYILFLDADDQLCAGALDALRHGFYDDDVVGVAGRFRAVDQEGNNLDIGTWSTEQLRPVLRRAGKMVDSALGMTGEALLTRLVSPPPGGVLLRRSAVDAIGGFDPRVKRSEDLDLLVRLTAVGRLVAVDAIVLNYRRQGSQRSASTRRRQFGRLWTVSMLIVRAPTGELARSRGRGAAAHFLDRAETRWRYGQRRAIDVVSVVRSLLLAALLRTLGVVMRAVRWPL
jgi:glycosyltransferase involved in cell wall biosynthesis